MYVTHFSPRRQMAKERPPSSADEGVSAHSEEISAYTSVFHHIFVGAHQYSPLSMTHYSSTAAIDPPSTRNLNQSGLSGDAEHPRYAPRSRWMSYQLIKPWLTSNRSPGALIHILDNDSLLNIFYLYRPVILDESEADDAQILSGGEWDREWWWYRLVQVCRRWRYIMLESFF